MDQLKKIDIPQDLLDNLPSDQVELLSDMFHFLSSVKPVVDKVLAMKKKGRSTIMMLAQVGKLANDFDGKGLDNLSALHKKYADLIDLINKQ